MEDGLVTAQIASVKAGLARANGVTANAHWQRRTQAHRVTKFQTAGAKPNLVGLRSCAAHFGLLRRIWVVAAHFGLLRRILGCRGAFWVVAAVFRASLGWRVVSIGTFATYNVEGCLERRS